MNAIKEYYSKVDLSDQKKEFILRQAQNFQKSRVDWKKKWVRYLIPSVLSLTLLLTLGIGSWYYVNLTQNVMAEVVLNHEKDLQIDHSASEYPALQKALSKVDFNLRPPQHIRDKYQCLGGRYCSIQGQLAGQLKLLAKNGARATLYVTPVKGGLRLIGDQYAVIRGIEVLLWKENDLFYAMASYQ